MSTPDDTRAFPVGHDGGHQGMTLRDYFAAQALAGYITSAADINLTSVAVVATWSYQAADAMLRAREKKP